MPSGTVSNLWRLYLFIILFNLCKVEKIKYISLERPVVLNYNKKYVTFFNASARRYSRGDPKYYISGHGESRVPLDNRILLDIHFYKSSGNTYKRTFFELHYKLCDLINKDTFLGSSIKRGSFKGTCPFPSGSYHVENITIPIESVPASLPLKKGRICVNVSYVTGDNMGSGYIDLEIKEKQVQGIK
ncbi:PREDICTED: uncharacterized protein LOC106116901 [Papilio xuthus]|uniref:Uncharacterized protein LOC106116901 n=1 Tax=Papilio xuthus TaxID=66420 RepID=A0AAJ7E7V7_PAPXU|nr:PREDICTED: uncharacterized protein LOC106116901 [Papilio xuthus]